MLIGSIRLCFQCREHRFDPELGRFCLLRGVTKKEKKERNRKMTQ